MVKLLDYQDRWDELEKSDNPFALVVMAHLKAKATVGKPESRLEWKTRLLEWLHRQGKSQEEVVDLFRFLELVMVLPEDLQEQFDTRVKEVAVSSGWPITPFERNAMRRGALQTAREDVLELLEVHFGSAPPSVAERLQFIQDLTILKRLLRLAHTAASLEEFERDLPQS